jgi:hypothetical protein
MKVKGKVVKHYAMKTYGGSGGIALLFLTSALDGSEWSASSPGSFTPGEKGPVTNWIGGWVSSRVGLDAMKKRKPYPCRESNPGVQPVANRYTD